MNDSFQDKIIVADKVDERGQEGGHELVRIRESGTR